MKFGNTCLKLCFAALAVGIPFIAKAQQNLVPNPSFELYTTCPLGYVYTAPQFSSWCNNWRCYTSSTADYYNVCSVGQVGIPANDMGYQFAARGNAYAGAFFYVPTTNYKEHIAAAITPMQIGRTYEVAMSVSLANRCSWAVNDFGVHFYDVGPLTGNPTQLLSVTPKVYYSSYGIISDTTNWTRLTANFTADSAYDNIIIGGFKNDSVITKTLTGWVGTDAAYYYIDSVIVKPLPAITINYPGIALCAGDSISVPYTVNTGFFKSGNSFTVQLSNSSGNFISPVNIGSRIDSLSDTIKCKIPANTLGGSFYRLRIMAVNPSDSSYDNGVNIQIKTSPQNVSANNNTPVCAGDTVKLFSNSATTGVSYNWSGPAGFTSSAKDPVILNAQVSHSGSYIVNITLNGCSVKDTEMVQVKPMPNKPTAGSNTPVCPATTLNLTAAPAIGVTYSWTGPGGFADTAQNPSRANMQTTWAGNYIITANFNGCLQKDTETIVVTITTPTPTAGSNSPVCVGGFLNLTASNVTNATYLWTGPNGFSSTQQNPVRNNVSGLDAGVYSVTANINGCISLAGTTTTVVNTGPSVSAYANPGDTICTGDTAKFVALPFNAGASPTYQWYRNGNLIPGAIMTPYATNNIADGDVFYTLMTAGTGCNTAIQSNDVVMHVLPIVPGGSVKITVAPDSNVWPGVQLYFTATVVNCNNPQYQWKRNGNDIVGAIMNPLSVNHLSTGDVISCMVTCKCGDPKAVVSNGIKLKVDTKVGDPSHALRMTKVYPNPVTNQLTIEGAEKGTLISVSDITGRVLFRTVSTQVKEIIDMCALSAGTYILQLQSADGYRMNMKLVKE
jgi:hypothetical protein